MDWSNQDLYKAAKICDKYGSGLVDTIINLDRAHMALNREREILAGFLTRCNIGQCWCANGTYHPSMLGKHTIACLGIQKYMKIQWPDGPPDTWTDWVADHVIGDGG